MRIVLLLACLLSISSLFGQEISHEIKNHVTDEGKIYWNKKLPVYLRIASTPDDKGTLLKSENQSQFANPIFLDTEGVNYIRTRWAVDKTTMKTAVPQQEILMEVYADSKAPVNTLTVSNAPKKIRDGITYYGLGLNMSLAAADELAGVSRIFYKINTGAYTSYSSAVPFGSEGSYDFEYYSLDNVGNYTTPAKESFIVDLRAPATYHNVNGLAIDNVITTSTKIYFTMEDSLAGVDKTYYKFDEGEYMLYDGKSLNTSKLGEGEHKLTYYSIDYVNNKESEKQFLFYFDKTAPIMAADILGDRYYADDQVYFSGRTKLKLTAVDNKVGVKEIRYSINGQEYQVYDQPFYLPSVSGQHTVSYYSVDNLENKSQDDVQGSSAAQYKHNVNKVYVDLTGPDLSQSFVGKYYSTRDTVFINKDTKVLIKGNDPESGIGKITYSMDGSSEEINYSDPFTIQNKGFHLVDYYGYDNVNNRNVGRFFVYSDHDGPQIFHNFSAAPYEVKKGLNVYSSDVNLYLAATDDKVGLATIYYSINDGTFAEFVSKVKAFKKNTKYKLTIKAVDLLGNETLTEVEFFTGK
jgi:hypothetical protein